MPINHSLKCIFVHIPRTGGSTIERLLGMDGDVNIQNNDKLFGKIAQGSGEVLTKYLQHLTAREIRERLDKSVWDEYFKFAFVRNPWDRFVSVYRHCDGDMRREAQDKLGLRVEEMNLSAFVELAAKLKHVHLRDQYSFVYEQDRLLVDYLGYFENYHYHIRKILRILGQEADGIPRLRPSRRKKYWFYYRPWTYRKVRELYLSDVLMFNYGFVNIL